MAKKTIITVATTGAWPKKENNPNVPMTPAEISEVNKIRALTKAYRTKKETESTKTIQNLIAKGIIVWIISVILQVLIILVTKNLLYQLFIISQHIQATLY